MESAFKILQFARPGSTLDFSNGKEKELGLGKLINKLNFVNFREGSILVNFRHARYNRTITLEAAPLPCLDQKFECRWKSDLTPSLDSCVFENIFIVEGQKLVVSAPELVTMGEQGALFLLPEKSIEVNYRKTRRYLCEGVAVEFIQNSARFEGALIDFSAVSFRIEMACSPSQDFLWVNPEVPVHVVFSRGDTPLYSGECRIISQNYGLKSRIYVLEPMQNQMQRFKAKEIRSSRYELLPLPNVVFQHPLTGKTVDLKVGDISGSGFSVHEDFELSVLLPGMVVPEVELRVANGFTVRCTAQVIYRQAIQQEECDGAVKCGLSYLDMDIRDHVNLLSLLSLARDKSSYISNKVNTEELWHFFFETGFIYPEKYSFVQANKQKLKEMYDTLYTCNPSIARHFIYQEKGAILGHMAMLRFYQKSWLVHHHAANKSESNTAGLVVLSQLAHSINDCHNLRSAHMDYIICYYRPENKFPNRVFGTAARIINEQKGCSIDTFAYLHYRRTFAPDWSFAGPWKLLPATEEDLFELESWYEQESGGLMLQSLNLHAQMVEGEELSEEYRKLGFSLKRHCFTLKKQGRVKAVVAVNLSDAGLNLSDLTNCIQVLVVDQEQFPKEILYLMLSILTHKYEQEEIPVLVYPVSYADSAGMLYDKKYCLWALNIQQNGAEFLKYLTNMTTKNRNRKQHTSSGKPTGEADERHAVVQ